MTYDEFINLLSEVVSVYSGDNLPEFVEKIDSVKDAGQFLNQDWVPKEKYDSLFDAYKLRYQEEFAPYPTGKDGDGVIADISEPGEAKETEVEEMPDEADDEDSLPYKELSYADLI